MAGVYIANMKLPTVCDECESGFVHTIGCTKRMFFNDRSIARHPECPLHFVQDHGRLIDADAYEDALRGLGDRDYRREKGTIQDAIKFLHPHYAPTLIPADKET